MTALVFKLVHIVSVIAFLGNITTGLFWHAHAARTRDPRLLAHAMDGIIRSDRWFTIPGVILIILSGVSAAMAARLPILGTPWILWSLVLFSVSGVVFVSRVAPLQKELHVLAASQAFDWERYRAVAIRWELWGAIALATPLGSLAMMILKPAF